MPCHALPCSPNSAQKGCSKTALHSVESRRGHKSSTSPHTLHQRRRPEVTSCGAQRNHIHAKNKNFGFEFLPFRWDTLGTSEIHLFFIRFHA
jgi:hypothetical protein